jgi:hypothetical protein
VIGSLWSDPKARRAYLLTKLGVFLAAALATWPLARAIGPKAWIGLGVFGVLLGALTVLVMGAGAVSGRAPATPRETTEETDEPALGQPVRLPVEDSLDLHSFPPAEIPEVVAEYLVEAHAQGFREVRLIHGRGIGVQRERVRGLLARHPLVASFADAPPERGGWGATVTHLVAGEGDLHETGE